MTEQIEYKYKLFKGSDDQVYVSVGLLMDDIKKSIEQMMNIDVTELSDDNKQLFELKILGLKTVYEFMGALQTEQWLKDKAKEIKGEVPLNAEGKGVISLPVESTTVH